MMVSVCVGSIRGTVIQFLVKSILAQTYQDWELIIVTQGNDPQLKSEVDNMVKIDTRIRTLHSEQFGRSNALNLAVKEAKGDILAFTDDDCEAASDWLETIVTCFTTIPKVGIVAGNLIAPKPKKFSISTCPATYTIECVYDPATSGYEGPSGFYWGGANFAVSRSVISLVGPFDKYLGVGTTFPCGEDVDYALRAEILGVVMWTTPKSVIYHTYGRRQGLKSVLNHYRGYAMGSGALGAKLKLWDHRLSKVWGQPQPLSKLVKNFILHPGKSIISLYKSKYIKLGYQNYIENYELTMEILSKPKN